MDRPTVSRSLGRAQVPLGQIVGSWIVICPFPIRRVSRRLGARLGAPRRQRLGRAGLYRLVSHHVHHLPWFARRRHNFEAFGLPRRDWTGAGTGPASAPLTVGTAEQISGPVGRGPSMSRGGAARRAWAPGGKGGAGLWGGWPGAVVGRPEGFCCPADPASWPVAGGPWRVAGRGGRPPVWAARLSRPPGRLLRSSPLALVLSWRTGSGP
jgi:hypothetical protein